VGGGTAPVTNLLPERFSRDFGQNLIVDNRPGGDGVIGINAAAKAAPDGYTLLGSTVTIIVNYWLHPDLPYNTLKDFTPVSTLSRAESVLAVHASFPANDLKEFISYARANPGKVDVASVSASNVLNYQRFMNVTGTRLTTVNYKGGGQALVDLLGGHVPVYIAGVGNVQSFIRAGKLKGLAISGDKRSPVLPDVPTFPEAGLKDFDTNNWFMLFAPSKTPRDIIEKLNAELRRIMEAPDVAGALAKQSLTPYLTTVSQSEKFVRAEADRIGKLIKDSGLKAGD
jgi:tripartite-type tricarboxylate transporter receptor subunit TctC